MTTTQGRFKLIGPAPTIQALHEQLRELDDPIARVISINSHTVLFKTYWYATVDFAPVSITLTMFDDGLDTDSMPFRLISPDMA